VAKMIASVVLLALAMKTPTVGTVNQLQPR
jgi:hypothetical protein